MRPANDPTPVAAHDGWTRDDSAEGDDQYRELSHWLTAKVAGYLGLDHDEVDLDTPLADLGIDSIKGLALCADLQAEQGLTADATIVWDHPTITELATYLIYQSRR
jgi:acyl carrier protein